MSNMIFLVLLALGWAGILEGLNLRERATGIADGNIEGHNYTVIQRGKRVYVVLPDYHPWEQCEEIVRKLLKKLRPEAEVEVMRLGRASTHCNYCLESSPFPYRCHRCRGWYCQEHRLPERHNCPGLGGAKMATKLEIKMKETAKKAEERGREKVEAVEIPCG